MKISRRRKLFQMLLELFAFDINLSRGQETNFGLENTPGFLVSHAGDKNLVINLEEIFIKVIPHLLSRGAQNKQKAEISTLK